MAPEPMHDSSKRRSATFALKVVESGHNSVGLIHDDTRQVGLPVEPLLMTRYAGDQSRVAVALRTALYGLDRRSRRRDTTAERTDASPMTEGNTRSSTAISVTPFEDRSSRASRLRHSVDVSDPISPSLRFADQDIPNSLVRALSVD
jgi:hypothetical protein